MWGTILSTLGNVTGGIAQNAANKSSAKTQMEFQRDMSNTSHEREVADLKRAGLNPMLSVMGGHGASTPSGASYNAVDAITPALNSSKSLSEAKKSALEVENVKATNDVLKTQATLNDFNSAKSNQEAIKTMAERERVKAETEAIKFQLPKKEFMNRGYDIGNKILNPIQQLLEGSSSVKSLLNSSKNTTDQWSAKGMLAPPTYK